MKVISEGYEKANMKDMEHRWWSGTFYCMVFDQNSPIIIKKNRFLSKSTNKHTLLIYWGHQQNQNNTSKL